jgi:hypothetical protein
VGVRWLVVMRPSLPPPYHPPHLRPPSFPVSHPNAGVVGAGAVHFDKTKPNDVITDIS